MTTEYGILVSTKLKGRISRCPASVRAAIRDGLHSIAVTAGKSRGPARSPLRKGPALRFYVYEGYRIFYQLDTHTRRVVVLDFGTVPVG
jgi:hypothetical protein